MKKAIFFFIRNLKGITLISLFTFWLLLNFLNLLTVHYLFFKEHSLPLEYIEMMKKYSEGTWKYFMAFSTGAATNELQKVINTKKTNDKDLKEL